MRILIAEDEPDLRSVIAKTLEKNHYSVDACPDGQEALDFLEMAEYDAVVLDIMMPKTDGLTVLKTIRRQGKHTPVILLTARDSIQDRVTGLDAGADDYLVKPFAMDELLARLRVVLRTRSRVPQARQQLPHRESYGGQQPPRRIPGRPGNHPLLQRIFHSGVYDPKQGHRPFQGQDRTGIYGTMTTPEVPMWWTFYIRYLRKKIDENFEPKLIHTIRGAGYVLKESS